MRKQIFGRRVSPGLLNRNRGTEKKEQKPQRRPPNRRPSSCVRPWQFIFESAAGSLCLLTFLLSLPLPLLFLLLAIGCCCLAVLFVWPCCFWVYAHSIKDTHAGRRQMPGHRRPVEASPLICPLWQQFGCANFKRGGSRGRGSLHLLRSV